MSKRLPSNQLSTIPSSPGPQQLNLQTVYLQPRTANPKLLPQSIPSRRPEFSPPTQQHDEVVPDTDLPPLDPDLRGIGVSLKIESEEDPSQIFLRSAGHWRPVGSSTTVTDCELTIVLEVHVSAREDHGRFKYVELKVKLQDIPDKGEKYYIDQVSSDKSDRSKQGMNYGPRGPLLADETRGSSEKTGSAGGSLGWNGASINAAGGNKTTHDYSHHAVCKGFMEDGSLVRWTITENKARADGIFWYFGQWPNPTIRVKVPKTDLRKVTIGYQIICEFEPKKKWFQLGGKKSRYQEPERGFKWISFNLERSKFIDNIEETGQDEKGTGNK